MKTFRAFGNTPSFAKNHIAERGDTSVSIVDLFGGKCLVFDQCIQAVNLSSLLVSAGIVIL